MTSLHTFLHTVRLTAGGGAVSYSISVGSQAVCVCCLCDVACI